MPKCICFGSHVDVPSRVTSPPRTLLPLLPTPLLASLCHSHRRPQIEKRLLDDINRKSRMHQLEADVAGLSSKLAQLQREREELSVSLQQAEHSKQQAFLSLNQVSSDKQRLEMEVAGLQQKLRDSQDREEKAHRG